MMTRLCVFIAEPQRDVLLACDAFDKMVFYICETTCGYALVDNINTLDLLYL